jgi:two-component system, response regulator PdtaR
LQIRLHTDSRRRGAETLGAVRRCISMNDASELSFPVLVVDDETLIRMHAVSAIEDAGYTVYEAVDADDAIAIIEKHPDIRVMFTDVNMPGSMNGIKLAHYVRNRWPPIVIIVTSGLAKITMDQLPAGSDFLAKPYRTDHLLRSLRDTANRGRSDTSSH